MKIGVIVARLQEDELHPGHRKLIDDVSSVSDVVLILLGCSATKLTERNPLDYDTRALMVHEEYDSSSKVIVYKVQDNQSDEVWSKNLDEFLDMISNTYKNLLTMVNHQEECEITLHHSRDSFSSHYSGRYPLKEWEGLPGYAASDRRAEIAKVPFSHPYFRRGVIYAAYNRYPQVIPVVDMFVFNWQTQCVLLGKREGINEWRLFGGFVDTSDSSYVRAAQRELKEESGLVVPITNFETLGSFKIDDWRYPLSGKDHIMSTLFWVDVEFQNPKADDDIAETRWFPIDDVVEGVVPIAKEHLILIGAAREHWDNM